MSRLPSNPSASTVRRNPHLYPDNAVKAPVSVVRPPNMAESDLHDEISAECRRRGWLFFHGSTAHRTRRTVGEPDFIIFADCPRLLLVECKSKTGKQTPAQLAVAAHARKLGWRVHLVRDFEEFLLIADSDPATHALKNGEGERVPLPFTMRTSGGTEITDDY